METNTFETDKRALRDAVLDHVPFDGWTGKAFAAGAKQAGLDPDFAHRAFPRGAIDAIEYFNQVADEALLDTLTAADLDEMRIRNRITYAVRLRLEQGTGHRDAIRRAMTILSLPPNVPVGMRCLYRTVDTIWRAAGDTATDFNFYTKRALLAGVYSATVLYWLNDNSEGFAKTWTFLDRRIEEVMRIPKVRQRVKDMLGRFPDSRGFRNILKQARPDGRRM